MVAYYLLEKWQRKCAYCSKEKVPLQVEHMVPRTKGGSHQISNDRYGHSGLGNGTSGAGQASTTLVGSIRSMICSRPSLPGQRVPNGVQAHKEARTFATNDILYELPISFTQAALGDEVEVPTVDGKSTILKNSSWDTE